MPRFYCDSFLIKIIFWLKVGILFYLKIIFLVLFFLKFFCWSQETFFFLSIKLAYIFILCQYCHCIPQFIGFMNLCSLFFFIIFLRFLSAFLFSNRSNFLFWTKNYSFCFKVRHRSVKFLWVFLCSYGLFYLNIALICFLTNLIVLDGR